MIFSELVTVLANGIFLGSLFAMMGLGLSISFGIMKLVNIAHGDLIIVMSYLSLYFSETLGLSPFLSMFLVLPAAFVLGFLFQTALINPVQKNDDLPPLLVTFGLSILIENLLIAVRSVDPVGIDAGPIEIASFDIAGATLGWLPFIVFVTSIVLFLAYSLLLKRTSFGRTIRATADDPEIVQAFSVDQKRVFGLAMSVAFVAMAVAGMFLIVRTTITPFSGIERLLIAFEVVVIGGLGSIWGTFAAGILLGIIQILGFTFIKPIWGVFCAHAFFFIVLMLRPQGLFGTRMRSA